MDKDLYRVALHNTLNEIRTVCPDVRFSFLFTRDGLAVAADAQAAEDAIEDIVRSFQNLEVKVDALGGLHALLINGKDGKVILSYVNDMYLATVASNTADVVYLQSVTRIVVPTILKLLEGLAPTPLPSTPSQQLLVDTLSGFFVGDTVEIDPQVLEQWSEMLDGQKIDEVEIEALDGNLSTCKAKEIGDKKLRGKGIIRIPEKTCKALDVQKGDLVKVKPAAV